VDCDSLGVSLGASAMGIAPPTFGDVIRFLIMDRGPNFSARFRRTRKAAGIEAVRTPPQAPNRNPFIEGFSRSLEDECLNHTIPFGHTGLRHLVTEYLEHDHREGPHAGLNDQLIDSDPLSAIRSGPVARRKRLGGLLNFYHRDAA
jgi:putative transposase